MRWNRMITSVCIFLLQLSRLLIVFLGALMLMGTLFNKLDAPLGFHLGEDFRFEEQAIFYPKVTYQGVEYSKVSLRANRYYIDLEEIPVSKYWTIIPLLLLVVGLYFFLDLLIRLLKSIEEREFFSWENVKRLRMIGFLVIGLSIGKWLFSVLKKYFLSTTLDIEGLSAVRWHFSLNIGFFDSLLFLGLMILLVANAFEHGLRLKEEQELTI